ncbi:MAG: ABC transporter permease [Ruminococcus sp.]|nr:ABC transporter permease [Ruminococcus sp.]
MKNISVIFLKQLKDTLKNKAILIQFVMFPLMAVIMENTVKFEDMPEKFFVKLFSVMFVGMAPLTCISAIISEEKEKNTLRTLMMSNVKPLEYLCGIGGYVWLMCMAGTAIFAVCGDFTGVSLVKFVAVMAAGVILSELIGGVIGIFSKNQMSATSVTVPVMMIFSFLPMLSMFNDKIEKVANLTYTQHLSVLINGLGTASIEAKNLLIPAINLLIAVVLFVTAFKKRGME